MKLSDLPPLFLKKKRIPEQTMAELYVEATISASHEDMLQFRVQLAQYLDRSKRVDAYITTVLVYAAGNHQYNRKVEEFETKCRSRRSKS